MARLSSLLLLCAATATAITGTVSASPTVVRDSPVSLPFARRFKFSRASTLIAQDRARARVLKTLGHGKGASGASLDLKLTRAADVLVSNQATKYTVDVGVGTPPTNYTLLIDTGSSNTFVGTGKAYVKTASSQDTGNYVVRSFVLDLLPARVRT